LFPSFFTVALATAGLTAMAAPIIIHILNKRRFKRVDWAAMEFLRRAYKVRRRRVKLEELLLLVLRCLIVALFGAALARPYFSDDSVVGAIGDARTDRILVLDDSLSMKARTGVSSPAEEASKLLRTWVSALASESSVDSITLILTSAPAQPLFNRVPLTEDSTSQVLEELKELQPIGGSGDIIGALVEVEKMIGDGGGGAANQAVYVLTDLRAKDWASGGQPGVNAELLSSMTRIAEKASISYVIDLAGDPRDNLVIEDIVPGDKSLVAGTLARFDVVVRNFGEREATGLKLSLASGTGAPQTADLDSIPVHGTGTASFNVALPEAPETEDGDLVALPPIKISAELSFAAGAQADALTDDDKRYFPVRLSSGLRVLIVDGDPSGTFGQSETYFIRRAMSPRGSIRSGVTTEVIDESEFATLELDGYQVICLCNVYAVPEDRRLALEKWVDAGGGLVVTLGDQIDQEDWNKRMYRDGKGLLPVRLQEVDGDESEEKWVFFDPQDDAHPIFKLFEGGQNPLRSEVKIFQWWDLGLPAAPGEPDSGNELSAQVAVLATLTNDKKTPGIIERPFGDGRVMVLATSVDVDWNNWPLDVSFLVVMQEMTRYMAQSDARAGELAVGAEIIQPLDLAKFKPELNVADPAGETHSVQARPQEGAESGSTDWQATYAGTVAPGFYNFLLNPTDGSPTRTVLFAANLHSVESDLALASREAVSRDLSQAGVTYLQSPASLEELEEEVKKSELWRYVLYAVLALMALELFYGWRISARRKAAKPRNIGQGGRGAFARAALVALSVVALGSGSDLFAQENVIKPVPRPGGAIKIKPEDFKPQVVTELSAAELKTNEEIGDILEQADDLVQQQRYELATVLWQKALDTSSDTLFTRDDWKVSQGEYNYQVYKPVVAEIESTLATLPAEALKAYQLKADGDSEALIAVSDPSTRRRVLGEVAARFFLSSTGDDIAFELAGYMLDDLEYFSAARLLRKLLERHPLLSVSRTEILKRLAVAEARSGDAVRAAETLKELKASAGALPGSYLAAVEADIEAAASDVPDMPEVAISSVPADFANSPSSLVFAWEQPFELKLPDDWPVIPDPPQASKAPANRSQNRQVIGGRLIVGGGRQFDQPNAGNASDSRVGIKNSWIQRHLEPVGQILVTGDDVMFRNEQRLACFKAESGEARWLGMRSAMTSRTMQLFHFQDYAAQASLLSNGVIYTVEGQTLDFPEEELTGVAPPNIAAMDQRSAYQGREVTRARDNRLAAYDVRTGRLLWTRRANERGVVSKEVMAFAGKPEHVSGGQLAVAVLEGRLLWLVFIDTVNGETIRRTQICQEPAGECLVTSGINVTVSGGDAFVATGAGALACVDTNSGDVRWCTLYTRPLPEAMRANAPGVNPRFVAQQMMNLIARGQQGMNGWGKDSVFTHGQTVVLVPSDCDRVLGFSRTTGEFAWEAPKSPDGGEKPLGLIGFANGRIFVRGAEFVRCYEARGGRIAWETKTPVQFGNGLVTDGSVYASAERSVIRIDPKSGIVLAEITIEGSDEPPGSLFSDGKRLYGMTPSHIRAYTVK
jgi:outer membrane protein assembly factor BamB